MQTVEPLPLAGQKGWKTQVGLPSTHVYKESLLSSLSQVPAMKAGARNSWSAIPTLPLVLNWETEKNFTTETLFVLEATCFDLRLAPPAPEAHVFAVAEAWRSKSGGLFLTATSSPNRCKHIDAAEAPEIWRTAFKRRRRATKSGWRRLAVHGFQWTSDFCTLSLHPFATPLALSQLQVLISKSYSASSSHSVTESSAIMVEPSGTVKWCV